MSALGWALTGVWLAVIIVGLALIVWRDGDR